MSENNSTHTNFTARSELLQEIEEKLEGMKKDDGRHGEKSFPDVEADAYNQALADVIKIVKEMK